MTPEQLAALVADKEAGTSGPWAVMQPILWIMAGPMQVADTRGWGYLTAPVNSNPELGGLGLSKDAAIAIQEANARRIARVPELEDAVIALTAEVARLSTPPDDAELAELVGILAMSARIWDENSTAAKGPTFSRGDCREFAKRFQAAADAITRLSHAIAAETAKREAMEEALAYYADQFCEGFCNDLPEAGTYHISMDDRCSGCKARAALAKHGSKT